ncbi:DUF4406 domain-containing protein [Nakamurella lactea]|uniref:DUF4406 domain-containing protein n=1 Tax=Nakamurella lactea TaxID=459515 RepID=UPI000419E614|nr:DUF4406 domain-containing protein [Nakamurella lactea]
MRVYISGPMTGIPGLNFTAFNDAEVRLKAAGYGVSNPAAKGEIDGFTWSDYLRVDLRELTTCGGIYLLPGWENSKGACLEYHVAKELGLTEVRL